VGLETKLDRFAIVSSSKAWAFLMVHRDLTVASVYCAWLIGGGELLSRLRGLLEILENINGPIRSGRDDEGGVER
jgi:hypothetical protein